MKDKLYITFPTTSDALGSEKFLKDSGFDIKLVPVPRELSAGCGFSVEASPDLLEKLKSALEDSDFETEDFVVL